MKRPFLSIVLGLFLTAAAGLAAQNNPTKPLLMPGVTSGIPSQRGTGSAAPSNGAETAAPGSGAALTAASADAASAAPKEEKPTPFDPKDLGPEWLKFDRNNDGKTDYAAKLDDWGRKVREAMDFNYDGYFDDFLYYGRGVLVREEIDSNYDRQVDIWVYIEGGIYIARVEQDTNFDGVPDVVKDYGKKK